MNNRKSILFLLVAIAAFASANFLMRHFNSKVIASGRSSLVENFDDAKKIVIHGRDRVDTVLEKTDCWRIVKPYFGGVDEQVVMKLFDALSLTALMDVITDGELLNIGRSRADFSLDSPAFSVTIGGDGKRQCRVNFGILTPTATGVYATIDGVDAVYVVPSEILKDVDLQADDFRRRNLFEISADDVSGFDIKYGSGALRKFMREGDCWKVDNEIASTKKVRQLLTDLTSAKAVNFVWPVGASNETAIVSASLLASFGLDADNAVTITMKGRDGIDRQLLFGKDANESDMVYAYSRNDSAIITVPAALKDAVTQEPIMFTDSRLFPKEVSEVMELSIIDGEDAYSLVRNSDGDWRLESPIIAIADAKNVMTIVERIVALSPNDADERGVKVALSTNTPPVSVSFSSVLGDLRFEDLRHKDILKIDPINVSRLVSTFGGNESNATAVVYSRDRRAWNVEKSSNGDAKVDEQAIADVLNSINPLVASKIVRLKVSVTELDDYGLDHPLFKLAIDQDSEDSIRRNIMVGKATEAGGYYATVGSSEAVFILDADIVSRLMQPLVTQ